jgi:hypothetical protein
MAASGRVLREYLAKMIVEHRADLNSESDSIERKDLFSLLVRASEEDSKFKLSDSELVSDNVEPLELWSVPNARCEVGNVFLMMFAGHGLCICYLTEPELAVKAFSPCRNNRIHTCSNYRFPWGLPERPRGHLQGNHQSCRTRP